MNIFVGLLLIAMFLPMAVALVFLIRQLWEEYREDGEDRCSLTMIYVNVIPLAVCLTMVSVGFLSLLGLVD